MACPTTAPHSRCLNGFAFLQVMFLFAVDEVEVILHRDKAGPAILLCDVQRLLELPRKHGEGTDISRFAGPHHFM